MRRDHRQLGSQNEGLCPNGKRANTRIVCGTSHHSWTFLRYASGSGANKVPPFRAAYGLTICTSPLVMQRHSRPVACGSVRGADSKNKLPLRRLGTMSIHPSFGPSTGDSGYHSPRLTTLTTTSQDAARVVARRQVLRGANSREIVSTNGHFGCC
jgi:hypothetical protein